MRSIYPRDTFISDQQSGGQIFGRGRTMNGLVILQISLTILFLIAFLSYALHILRYVFSDRSVIDERLRRYGRVTGR